MVSLLITDDAGDTIRIPDEALPSIFFKVGDEDESEFALEKNELRAICLHLIRLGYGPAIPDATPAPVEVPANAGESH